MIQQQRSVAWRILPVAVISGLMALAFGLGLHRYLSLDWLIDHREMLQAYVAQNRAFAVAGFALLYVAVVALSIPGAVFLTVGGGAIFGGLIGGAMSVLSATAGAVLVFLAARSAFGQALVSRAGPRLAQLLSGFRDDAASYLLFLRLVPVFPFALVNLAPAVAGVKIGTFAWTTLVGIVPGSFAFAFAGAGLESVIGRQGAVRQACIAAGRSDCAGRIALEHLVTREILLAFALLGVLALIPVLWRRIWGSGATATRQEPHS